MPKERAALPSRARASAAPSEPAAGRTSSTQPAGSSSSAAIAATQRPVRPRSPPPGAPGGASATMPVATARRLQLLRRQQVEERCMPAVGPVEAAAASEHRRTAWPLAHADVCFRPEHRCQVARDQGGEQRVGKIGAVEDHQHRGAVGEVAAGAALRNGDLQTRQVGPQERVGRRPAAAPVFAAGAGVGRRQGAGHRAGGLGHRGLCAGRRRHGLGLATAAVALAIAVRQVHGGDEPRLRRRLVPAAPHLGHPLGIDRARLRRQLEGQPGARDLAVEVAGDGGEGGVGGGGEALAVGRRDGAQPVHLEQRQQGEEGDQHGERAGEDAGAADAGGGHGRQCGRGGGRGGGRREERCEGATTTLRAAAHPLFFKRMQGACQGCQAAAVGLTF